MRSHEIDYEIIGDDMQLVEIELDPGETVIAEAGAMNYMEDGIRFEARMGDGSEADEGVLGKLLGAGKRMLAGESLFMTHFTNEASGKRRVPFAAHRKASFWHSRGPPTFSRSTAMILPG